MHVINSVFPSSYMSNVKGLSKEERKPNVILSDMFDLSGLVIDLSLILGIFTSLFVCGDLVALMLT